MKKVANFECVNCGTKYGVYMENGKSVVVDDNGKVVNKVEGIPASANAKLEALKKAGVDTTGFFAMGNADGDGLLYRIVNNVPTAIPEDDPIFLKIIEEGRLYDPRLAPRWVMSQMFQLFRRVANAKDRNKWEFRMHPYGTFNDFVQDEYGFPRAIKFLDEEFARQAKLLKKRDYEVLFKRNLFWNKAVGVAFAKDGLAKVEEYINTLGRQTNRGIKNRKCHGVEYKRIPGFGDCFVSELEKRIYTPIRQAIQALEKAQDVIQISTAWSCFRRAMITLPWSTKVCPEFIDAFKGFGAYATMSNMIHYHGCLVIDEYGVKHNKKSSLEMLELKAHEYAKKDCSGKTQGWRLFGMMKKLMEDNKIDINKKLKEWSEAKRK